MRSAPILNRENARVIFRNSSLESIFLNLENPSKIVDRTTDLAELVNMSKSKSEPFSRWVRYREGYSPSVVHKILEMFPIDIETQYILDPMCGSGSSQVAAQKIGAASAGTDVSPYAILVSNVKTSRLNLTELRKVQTFVQEISNFKTDDDLQFTPTEQYLSQYFPQENFAELIRIKSAVQSSFPKRSRVKDFLNVANLAILEDCSNRKKDGNGLSTRPSRVKDVLRLFENQIAEMLEDSGSANWLDVPSLALNRTALQIDESIIEFSKLFNKSLGAVIFSPPYANSFDYYESYKLELLFSDFFTIDSISEQRKNLIRSYRQMGNPSHNLVIPTVELLIDEILRRLPAKELSTGVRDGRSRLLPNMLRGYFEDMHKFLSRSAKGMPTGSYMAIVVDQSAYLGVLVPTDLILAEIGISLGFTLEKLVICRRAKTSGQQMNMQPALGEVLRETAVILRR
jgi:hypothetical protein